MKIDENTPIKTLKDLMRYYGVPGLTAINKENKRKYIRLIKNKMKDVSFKQRQFKPIFVESTSKAELTSKLPEPVVKPVNINEIKAEMKMLGMPDIDLVTNDNKYEYLRRVQREKARQTIKKELDTLNQLARSSNKETASFYTQYLSKLQLHWNKLMIKRIPERVVNAVENLAHRSLQEWGGAFDFEHHTKEAERLIFVHGTEEYVKEKTVSELPFFHEFELRFHTHPGTAGYANWLPSPEDINTVTIFKPAIIVWEDIEKNNYKKHWLLLLSNKTKITSLFDTQSIWDKIIDVNDKKIEEKKQKGTKYDPIIFLSVLYRKLLNNIGLEFREIDPRDESILMEKELKIERTIKLQRSFF